MENTHSHMGQPTKMAAPQKNVPPPPQHFTIPGRDTHARLHRTRQVAVQLLHNIVFMSEDSREVCGDIPALGGGAFIN